MNRNFNNSLLRLSMQLSCIIKFKVYFKLLNAKYYILNESGANFKFE